MNLLSPLYPLNLLNALASGSSDLLKPADNLKPGEPC